MTAVPDGTPEPWQVLARELRRAGLAYDLSIEEAHDIIAALDAAGYDIVARDARPATCPRCGAYNPLPPVGARYEDRCTDPWHREGR